MKKLILLFITLNFLSCGIKNKSSKTDNSSDLTKKITGVWEFIETTDTNGKKLDSYQGSFGTVQATGPKLIYNKDKTYIKVFTPVNSDTGFWRFNSANSTIEHDLYIDSESWVGKDLIEKKLAEKKPDGKYYELIEDRIIKIDENTMYIDNRGLVDIYKKIK